MIALIESARSLASRSRATSSAPTKSATDSPTRSPRAAERGVAVRILLDWIGVRGTSRRFLRELRASGHRGRRSSIRPGFHRWLGLVPRDHRKLLVVDGAVGITGGVGIGREWTTGVAQDAPLRDGATPRCASTVPPRTTCRQAFDRHVAARRGPRTPRLASLPPPAGARRASRSRTDEPALVGIIEGEPLRLRVSRALQIQAISARRSIWIATAYFTPSPSEVEALNGAARDGVDVRILVPSRNDHPWVSLLARRYYRRLLTNGVRIWEWRGEMMHAKTSVVDGRWVRVGSTDFNPLGVAINYELDAVIEDASLGEEAERMFLADLEGSREITL